MALKLPIVYSWRWQSTNLYDESIPWYTECWSEENLKQVWNNLVLFSKDSYADKWIEATWH